MQCSEWGHVSGLVGRKILAAAYRRTKPANSTTNYRLQEIFVRRSKVRPSPKLSYMYCEMPTNRKKAANLQLEMRDYGVILLIKKLTHCSSKFPRIPAGNFWGPRNSNNKDLRKITCNFSKIFANKPSLSNRQTLGLGQ